MLINEDRYSAPPSGQKLWFFLLLVGVGLTFIFAVINLRVNWSLLEQHFTRWIALPAVIPFIILVIACSVAYLRSSWVQVRLFTLFCLALVWSLISFPEFTEGQLYTLNVFTGYIGRIAAPIMFVHFVIVFVGLQAVLKTDDYLLPLIYAPVLPSLVHLPILVIHNQTFQYFDILINSYTIIYGIIGLGLLIKAIRQNPDVKQRKQYLTLILGLMILPLFLFVSFVGMFVSVDQSVLYQVFGRYGFVGFAIAMTIAMIRYEPFDMSRVYRSHFLFIRALIIAIVVYFAILLLPRSAKIDLFLSDDLLIIFAAIATFFLARISYHVGYRWWLDSHYYSTLEELRASFRIFLHDLLKVKSLHDLEFLVSWNIPLDFGLKHAELSVNNRPNQAFALSLPLNVGKASLGTLFLGPKVSGSDFRKQELEIFSEMQKQIALVLFSLEIDSAIQTTEQLTQLRSKFLTNITHELRTPLNGIINYIGFVVDDYLEYLNGEQKNLLLQALQGAEKLEQIINNILDMSKIEAQQMTLNIQPTDLTEIITHVAPTVEEMLEDKPVTFVTKISSDFPLLNGDKLRLRQILVNMLSNAAKFTEFGKIELTAYPENGNIILEIADTGIGIEENVLPTIFQQFVSSGPIDARKYAGPGLSMPITKSLVELHGGDLHVESQPGRGTTFTVTLPIQKNEVIQ